MQFVPLESRAPVERRRGGLRGEFRADTNHARAPKGQARVPRETLRLQDPAPRHL